MNFKHLILSAALTGCAIFAYGQAMNVSSASNSIQDYRSYKDVTYLKEAKEYIDKAIKHEKTSQEAKTWFYHGYIHQLLHQDTLITAAEKPRDLLGTAVASYIKAAEIDAEGDKKRDLDREKKSQLSTNLLIASQQAYAEGVKQYQGKDYDAALKSFEVSASVYRLPDFKAKTDTNAFNNAAVAASAAGKPEVAIKYYDELLGLGYKPGEMYYLKAKAYKDMGEEDKYMATIEEGLTNHPDSDVLLTEKLNLQLKSGKDGEAQKLLEQSIAKDPNNKVLRYNLGTIYYNLADFDNRKDPYAEDYQEVVKKSEEAFVKATEIDPEYFDAYYNLGALYINHAKVIEAYASAQTDDKKYNEENAKADAYYDKSLPTLEKALELNPKDYNTMVTLKQLYLRKGMTDKFKEMDEKLKQ